ncbi:transposable element Tc1 transposase [Trichonephila clavipes]|uniref:Transposable element Tc1 transposase n=1 Tax=Trichonephila clavipes TaxID=2585209 RepID=A0A8X7BKR0_TRICX|nr:transposable element Tc1 transposase [Trichonephila clavipes]
MDDLRVVYVKVKGEQEMVNAVIDTGAQMPVVRPDVVEGQSIDNRGSIQITSAFGEHEMGEVKDSNMELNDFRHGVVPVSKNLVNDMLICFSDYEVLIENSQMIRNPAKLREPSKEEGIISSTDLKSVCSQEVITNLRPETYTQSLLNVPNGDLVAVKINASNVQTNGQAVKITPSCCLSEKWRIINLLDDIWMLLPEIESLGSWRKVTSVAAEFGIAHSIVSRLWRQFQTTGTAIRGFSSGRPRGTTPADDRYIVLQARRNRRQTAGEIARHTTQATGRPISRFTVARRLHGGGLFARCPVRCVPLTPTHRRRRSLWCREHRNWRDNEWGRVLFTDESRFSLSSDSHRILTWRERGSRNHPSNIIKRDRYGGRGVLIVRVQYFVRGGFVGYRSRASSKHLSPHLPVDELDSSGVKKGLRCRCKMHVWVSGPQRNRLDVDVWRSDVTALALSYRTFPLRKV